MTWAVTINSPMESFGLVLKSRFPVFASMDWAFMPSTLLSFIEYVLVPEDPSIVETVTEGGIVCVPSS